MDPDSLATYTPTTWQDFRLAWNTRTLLMGIVNVTPDSFAGDGLAQGADPAAWAAHAVAQGLRQVAEGADVIDVGGASSRPGATAITPEEETRRVVPTIRGLRAALPAQIPISIDTTSVMVATAALAAGASIINDISGLHAEPELAKVAAEAGVPIIIMANMRGVQRYDVIADLARYLARGMDRALTAGVAWERIILDPGFGFGHTPAQNIALLHHLDALLALGRPLLLGVSRKSTLGYLLGDAPVAERLEASLAAMVAGVLRGAAMVRVHDVLASARALRVADAIKHGVPDESGPTP
jgi:dihydropteroate synthase